MAVRIQNLSTGAASSARSSRCTFEGRRASRISQQAGRPWVVNRQVPPLSRSRPQMSAAVRRPPCEAGRGARNTHHGSPQQRRKLATPVEGEGTGTCDEALSKHRPRRNRVLTEGMRCDALASFCDDKDNRTAVHSGSQWARYSGAYRSRPPDGGKKRPRSEVKFT
jgi:hypothetical protein